MHSSGGKKIGSPDARASAALPGLGHDSEHSTIDTPTTNLLPLLSEAHTARAEADFEDVPEVIAEAPGSPPQPMVEYQELVTDTPTGTTGRDGWTASPLSSAPMPYDEATDITELEDDDLPELVAEDLEEHIHVGPNPGISVPDLSQAPEPSPEWLGLVEEVVEFIGEMEEDAGQLRPEKPDSAETCRHVAVRLTLMLARNGVTVIGIKEQGAVETIMGQIFDRARHQPAVMDIPARDARIVEVVSPGFAVGQRVLRRARVRCQ